MEAGAPAAALCARSAVTVATAVAIVTRSLLLQTLIRILKHLMLTSSRTQVRMMMMMMMTAIQAGQAKAPRRAPTRGLALLQAGAVAVPKKAPAPAAPEGATYPTRFSAWDLRALQLQLETHALCPCTYVSISG